MYAVVQSGGKQHKVRVGQTLDVELLAAAAEAGQTVELDQVLLIGKDDATLIGQPTLAGARVLTTVVNPDAKGEKIIVFKYKSKVRYKRRKGHRQHFTRLQVTDILEAGAVPTIETPIAAAAPVTEDTATEAPVTEALAVETAAVEASAVEVPADETAAVEASAVDVPADETPAPKRTRRKAADDAVKEQ